MDIALTVDEMVDRLEGTLALADKADGTTDFELLQRGDGYASRISEALQSQLALCEQGSGNEANGEAISTLMRSLERMFGPLHDLAREVARHLHKNAEDPSPETVDRAIRLAEYDALLAVSAATHIDEIASVALSSEALVEDFFALDMDYDANQLLRLGAALHIECALTISDRIGHLLEQRDTMSADSLGRAAKILGRVTDVVIPFTDYYSDTSELRGDFADFGFATPGDADLLELLDARVTEAAKRLDLDGARELILNIRSIYVNISLERSIRPSTKKSAEVVQYEKRSDELAILLDRYQRPRES